MSNVEYARLDFQQVESMPAEIVEELRKIPQQLPFAHARMSLLSRHDRKSKFSNVRRRQQFELDTWLFDYTSGDHRNKRTFTHQSVLYFRSALIQFSPLRVRPMALTKMPDFITRLVPFLNYPDPFPSHPKLTFTCMIHGADRAATHQWMTEEVLSFLEDRVVLARENQPRVLPPGVETIDNRMIFYRAATVIPAKDFRTFLGDAEELLRLLTMAGVPEHHG